MSDPDPRWPTIGNPLSHDRTLRAAPAFVSTSTHTEGRTVARPKGTWDTNNEGRTVVRPKGIWDTNNEGRTVARPKGTWDTNN